jgi:hypothetical protein
MPYFIFIEFRHDRSYNSILSELKKLHAFQILENIYSLEMEQINAIQVRDHLKKFLEVDDGIIVVQSKSWAVANVEKTPYKLTEEEER